MGRPSHVMRSLLGNQIGALPARRSSFTSDALVSLAGGVLSRLITFAALPFITRLYGAADYGIWVVVLTLSGFLLPLATLRYELAMVLAPTRRMSAALALSIGAFTLAIGAAAGLGLLMAPRRVIEAITGLGPGNRPLVVVVPLLLVLLAAQAVMQAWATRQRQFTALNMAQLVQAGATAGATLLLPLLTGASAAAAAAGGILGLATGTSVLVLTCGSGLVSAARRPAPLVGARRGLRRYKVYALYMVPYSLSAGMAERVIQLGLASAFSLGTVGSFYIARQLMNAPATLIANALRQVLFAYGAQQDSTGALKDRVAALLTLLVDLLAPTLAFGLVWLKFISIVFFGTDWAYMPEFVWWSMFVAGGGLLASWLDRVLDVLGRQALSVKLQVASDALVVSAVLGCVYLRLGPVETVAVLSSTSALVALVWIPVVLVLLGHEKSRIAGLGGRLGAFTAAWGMVHYAIHSLDAGPKGLVLSAAVLVVALAGHGLKLARQYRFVTVKETALQ